MIYENTTVYTIAKGCPWYKMQQYFGPPNVNWCEPTTCAIINEPSTAWSNFGMMIPAIFIYRHSKKFKSFWTRFFSIALFTMGFFSFIYHSTNNLGTQYLDFLGMYVYTGAILVINFLRMRSINESLAWPIFWGQMILNGALFFLFLEVNLPIQQIIMLNIALILITEFWVYKTNPMKGTKYSLFYISLACWALAQTFSLLDHTRTWCNPNNLVLHGHAIWHVLAGVSAVFNYLYYKQFDEVLFSKSKNDSSGEFKDQVLA